MDRPRCCNRALERRLIMPFNSGQPFQELHAAGGHVSYAQSGSQYTIGGSSISVPAALPPMPEAVQSAKVKALASAGNPGHPGTLGSLSSAMLQALVLDHKGTYSTDPAAITFLKGLGMK